MSFVICLLPLLLFRAAGFMFCQRHSFGASCRLRVSCCFGFTVINHKSLFLNHFLCGSFRAYGRTGKPIRAVFMICTFLPATKVAGYFLPVPPGLFYFSFLTYLLPFPFHCLSTSLSLPFIIHKGFSSRIQFGSTFRPFAKVCLVLIYVYRLKKKSRS